MRFLCLLALLLFGTIAYAGIGESAIQLADRYGTPKDTSATKINDKNSPLIEGAVHHTYEYQGWKIRAAFLPLDGPCVRMYYQKIVTTGVKPQIQDYELQAIAAGNTPAGMPVRALSRSFVVPDRKSAAEAKASGSDRPLNI